MFTIFKEENEPLSERAKVDELLTKVHNLSLSAAVARLQYQLNTQGISFTVAANHLNSEVSQTPDYQISHKINATNTSGRGGGSGRGGRGGRGYQGRGPGRGRFGGRGAKASERLQHTTLRRNGRSCLLKIVTKFVKNATRKESPADPKGV
jgi:hypothetical protein